MAFVRVNGRVYYTKSVRHGRRVTSISYGPAIGELARCAAAADRLEQMERRAERAQRQEEWRQRSEARRDAITGGRAARDRLDAIDREMATYFRRVASDVDA